MDYSTIEGDNRTRVQLRAISIGDDLIIQIYNSSPHIGAVALGEYDFRSTRASVSVITRVGHKDDLLAQKAAYTICKSTHKPVCVIAGIHLDNITQDEIRQIAENAEAAVGRFVNQLM